MVTDESREDGGGGAEALAAAVEQHEAATLMKQADDRLSAAMTHSSRIVWNPQDRMVERWVGIVFLQ